MLTHLIALGVKHQARTNDILKGHRVEDHRSDGMKREEPSSRLVNTLIDEVGGEEGRSHSCALVSAMYQLVAIFVLTQASGLQALSVDLTLKRIVKLRIRH